MKNIRNFCIIAHIDHGKSTLADRLLEFTGTISKREMKEQILDQMDLERERGITIKLQPVRMRYKADSGDEYTLNLIDTPGHVDFTYEVSRSLAAVEGAILLVDATQGVQAQTIGNLYLALEENLTIIPVVNKMDLPNAEPDRVRDEIVDLLGCEPEDVLFASGKTGEGVEGLVKTVVEKVSPPEGDPDAPLRALIFDSVYDSYRGVVAYVRVVDGSVTRDNKFQMVATLASGEITETGHFLPKMSAADALDAGEIGYVVTGFKDIDNCRVGDTITVADFKELGTESLSGYREVRPMVFAGIFPKEGNDFERLREAVLKLKLNDAALVFEPEHSTALGFGFRCGFLGMLHLEIAQERLRREHGLDIVVTLPSVAYEVTKTDGEEIIAKSPADLPDPSRISSISEPWVRADIVTPKEYLGAVMAFSQERRGVYLNTEYLSSGGKESRAIIHYDMPLASILVDFYDKLKSATSGYASLNYELTEYRPAKVVRMDILVNAEPVESLSLIVYNDAAQREGRRIVDRLKENLPRQQFEIRIQAAVGGKIIASSRIAPYRKDVTAGLYGGDVSRKQKLLEKQKKGKKRMGKGGKVDIPPEAYIAVLKR
ncbi:MAG: translation elongation factor 4 [Patescibacteria group bacterium]|nr:translation elongation factor 4 [Patescibacteria group bacterium]